MKKAYLVLFVSAIVALFAHAEVMANAVDPCTQISGPSIVQVAGIYKWTYQFTGTVTPSTQLYILAPVCTPATMYTVDPGGQVLSPGQGDTQTGFGVGDISNVVIKLTFSSPNSFYFYTDKSVPTRSTSMQYKSGRSYSICPNIQGPACPGGIPAVLTPHTITECKTMGGLYVLITRDPSTLCATDVQQCSNAACTVNCLEISPSLVDVDGQALIGCTTPDGNQMCQECIIFGESSPGCYTYSSGGRAYKICTK